MSLSYRLGSSSLFVRAHEDSMEPKCVVFLSTEGTKTEVQYFKYIDKYREQIGINAIVHVEVLRRYDTNSDPENVLELLEEYIQFRENKMFERIIDSLRLKNYSIDFIKSYFLQRGSPISLSMIVWLDTLKFCKKIGIDLMQFCAKSSLIFCIWIFLAGIKEKMIYLVLL